MNKIAIIGLGYVGLPLARLFAAKYPVVGFDINQTRVTELMSGHDATLEVEDDVLQRVLLTQTPHTQEPPPNGLFCTTNLDDIAGCNIYIITVPTPIDKNNRPDLTPLIRASETVGKVISKGDINIAFVNELAKIFNRMDIDTHAVLEAACTKWNFLPFKPGLVGGHCIGVDPYYLAQKAQEAGYHPEIILAGRRMNDSMGAYVASEVVKLMIKKGKPVKDARALMLGITFKENCPDIRNTRAIDIYHELTDFGMTVDVYDPWASPSEVLHEYGIHTITQYPENDGYTAIILAVAHKQFLAIDLNAHKQTGTIIYDVKGILDKSLTHGRL
jgi:UDP-N-acetyl-D-mannosaminuronate dehydrogenase